MFTNIISTRSNRKIAGGTLTRNVLRGIIPCTHVLRDNIRVDINNVLPFARVFVKTARVSRRYYALQFSSPAQYGTRVSNSTGCTVFGRDHGGRQLDGRSELK